MNFVGEKGKRKITEFKHSVNSGGEFMNQQLLCSNIQAPLPFEQVDS